MQIIKVLKKNISENNLFDRFIEYSNNYKEKIDANKESKIKKSLSFLKNKAKSLEDIYKNSKYIIKSFTSGEVSVYMLYSIF